MKLSYFTFFLIALAYFFTSCQNDGTQTGTDQPVDVEEEDGPITHNLDTAVGYCFQMAQKGFEETVEIKLTGNKIEGRGIRIYMDKQIKYELYIEGKINGKEADISIQSTNLKEPTESFTHTETWELDEQEMWVRRREIRDLKGDYKYYRTNCYFYENKDSTRYDTFGGFFEGYAVVSKSGLYGLVNENWEETVPLQYHDLGVVNEGSIVFYDENEGRYGLLDVNGNVLVEPKYNEIHCFNEGLAAFLNDDGKWGFLGKDLKVAIKAQYKNIFFFKPDPHRHPFNEGLANVQMENNTWNYIDTKGNVIIRGNFLFTEGFVGGKARVFKDNKWYYINKAGKCVENCE